MLAFAAIGVALAYVAIVVTMYVRQDSLMYFPDRMRTPPRDAGLPEAREVELAASDGTPLLAWYAPAATGRPTILFLHGNGGAIRDRADRFRFYAAPGNGVFFLSYRGYGGSGGAPSEAGLHADAEAAYDWLMANGGASDRLVVVGESLGSGVAAQLAARRRVAALALEAPFSSVADVAAAHYWWLPVHLLIRDRYEAGRAIAGVGAPLLILHGALDRTVPIRFGRKLYASAAPPKEFVEIAGADHAIATAATFARELAFFDAVLARQ